MTTTATALQPPKQWLDSFFEQRKLRQPDGRKLYAYRLSSTEYESLRALLRHWASDDIVSTSGYLAPGVAETFVLYGAAWWQREYSGGHWRWEDVVNSFGASATSWHHALRSTCVTIGLQFWKQRIRDQGMRYFGVLVEQGGLPSRLLAESRGNVATVIRILIRRAARVGVDVDYIAAQAGELAERLPRALQNAESFSLIAQMVVTTLELKREHKLSKGEDPVAKLDRLEPDWRERFPIALEDQAALALLKDMVGEAAAIDVGTRASPFIAERYLVQQGAAYQLVSQVILPSSLDAEVFGELLQVDAGDLPSRLTVEVGAGEVQVHTMARKALGATPARYQFAPVQAKWTGSTATCEHSVVVSLGTGRQAAIPVPGGVGLDAEAPWVFTPNGEEWRLAAQGSARIQQERAFAVVDPSWPVEPSTGSTVERVGATGPASCAREVISITGEVSITVGELTYRIRTGDLGAEGDQFAWEGRRCPFASRPSLAFYGLPKLWRFTAEGTRETVPGAEIEWRPAGAQRPFFSAAAIQGPVDAIWRHKGEVRLRTRMLILARQGKIAFKAGESVVTGHITLPATWDIESVTCEGSDTQLATRRSHDGIQLDLRAEGEAPESIKLTLDWKGAFVPAQLALPFPASGGRFFDRHGHVLPKGATATRQQLLGMRLRVVDTDPDHPAQHRLAFTLACDGLHSTPPSIAPVSYVLALDDGRGEIRLIDYQQDIESMLCLTDILDAYVRVDHFVGHSVHASLKVKRYQVALFPQATSVLVSPSDSSLLSLDELVNAKVMAVPVSQMHVRAGDALEQVFSEGTPTGRWDLVQGPASNVPWMVYPAIDSAVDVRPVLVDRPQAMDDDRSVTGALSLQAALLVSIQGRRLASISARLSVLAQDFSHPEWEVVEGIWTNLGHLTLPSLDLWRAFATSPAALAAFACRRWISHDAESVLAMCRRLQSELGVLWETVPLPVWRSACVNLGEQWSVGLPPEVLGGLVPAQVAARLRLIRQQLPSLNTLLLYLTYEQTTLDVQEIAPISQRKAEDVARALWGGQDAALQTLLRNDRTPPSLKLFEQMVGSLEVTSKVEAQIKKLLWLNQHPCTAVANLPVVLAFVSCNGMLDGWWSNPKHCMELRQYRDYDRAWFSHAYDQAVAMFLRAGLYAKHN